LWKKRIDLWFYRLVLAGIYTFLLAPTIIVVLAAFNSGSYLRFPPEGFSLRWFERFLHSRPFIDSFLFSLKLAFCAAATSTVLGTISALYVTRYAGQHAKRILRPLLISPLMVPSILTAIALLLYFHKLGAGNQTFWELYAAHSLITLPYVFLLVSTVLYNFDHSVEEAARSLGASPAYTFFRITLPMIGNGIVSGAVFAFITSFDQFPISLVLNGPGYSTLPVQLFDYLRFEFDPTAAAVSTFNILLAFGIVAILKRFGGLQTLYGIKQE
jgi:putative spermidine/putrescine transport system permease protein